MSDCQFLPTCRWTEGRGGPRRKRAHFMYVFFILSDKWELFLFVNVQNSNTRVFPLKDPSLLLSTLPGTLCLIPITVNFFYLSVFISYHQTCVYLQLRQVAVS